MNHNFPTSLHRGLLVSLAAVTAFLPLGLPAAASGETRTGSHSARTASVGRSAASKTAAQTASAISELKRQGAYGSFRSALQQALYGIETDRSGALTAENPAQRYVSAFGPGGVLIAPAACGKQSRSRGFSLRLAGFHYNGRAIAVRQSPPVQSDRRVEYRHGGLTEWYVNTPHGLEQGFTIPSAPVRNVKSVSARHQASALVLDLSVDGARAREEGPGAIALLTPDGASYSYRDLTAVDAAGRRLPARMSVEGGGIALMVDDRGARYPVAIDPLIVTIGPGVPASDTVANDFFGYGVSLSGDTAVVGAYGKNASTGAAYVFVRSASAWTQQQKLTASDGASGDNFGLAVSLSGDTAIVGAYGKSTNTGAAYVFVRNGATWTQQQKLTASDAAQDNRFGYGVSLNGDTAIVGAYGRNNGTGAAYVFVRDGSVWTQQQKLLASDGAQNDNFGVAVSLSGYTAVIGARDNNNGTGAAYAFVRSGSVWTEQQKLTASDAASGDHLGRALSLNGDTAVVGAYGKNTSTGAAYVFVRSGNAWSQQQKLTASDPAQNNQFGAAVSVSGDALAIGSHGKNTGTGGAYMFVRNGGVWSQSQTIIANDGAQGDAFGLGISLSGDSMVIGASLKNSFSGVMYISGDGVRSNSDSYALNPGGSLSTSLLDGALANDYDPQGLPLTAQLFKDVTGGALTLNADGTFTYTPNVGFTGADTFVYQARNSNGALSEPTQVTLNVTSDVTAVVQITRSGFRRNAATGRYGQTVTVKNLASYTLPGYVSLVFDSLSSNATLFGANGTTSATSPSGSPYRTYESSLAPGASVVFTVEFTNPSNLSISYTNRVLVGSSAR